jgi:hypothetical protein
VIINLNVIIMIYSATLNGTVGYEEKDQHYTLNGTVGYEEKDQHYK